MPLSPLIFLRLVGEDLLLLLLPDTGCMVVWVVAHICSGKPHVVADDKANV